MEIKNKMKTTLLSIGAIAALLLAGCSQQAKEDLSQAGDSASNAAKHTGDAVATDTKKAGEAVTNTAEAGVEAVKDTAENAADATMTPKVKTALLNAAGLVAKDINVETTSNTITLKGSVPDAKQKTQAETVTKGIAGTEFKVVNELMVQGKM